MSGSGRCSAIERDIDSIGDLRGRFCERMVCKGSSLRTRQLNETDRRACHRAGVGGRYNSRCGHPELFRPLAGPSFGRRSNGLAVWVQSV